MIVNNTRYPIVNRQLIKRNYSTLFDDDVLYVDATGGNVVITLPSAADVLAAAQNHSLTPVYIKKIDATANTVTITSPDNIDGAASYVLSSQNDSAEIAPNHNGSAYFILSTLGGGGGGGGNSNQDIFEVTLSANQSIPDTTFTTLQFDTVDVDTQGNFNVGTYTYTPNVAGYYIFSVSAVIQPVGAAGTATIYIYKNGGTVAQSEFGTTGTTLVATDLQVSKIVQMNGTTDNVNFLVFHSYGAPKNVLGTVWSRASGIFLHS